MFFSSKKTYIYSGCPLLRMPIGEINEEDNANKTLIEKIY